MTNQTASSTGALRWGLLFGVINAVILDGTSLPLSFLFPGASEQLKNLVGFALLGISLVLCGYAGYIAAKRSGSPYTGNSAGMYAGLVTAVISGSLSLLLLYISGQFVQHFILLLLFIFSLGFVFAIYVLLALAAGVIGGKLAQRGQAQPG